MVVFDEELYLFFQTNFKTFQKKLNKKLTQINLKRTLPETFPLLVFCFCTKLVAARLIAAIKLQAGNKQHFQLNLTSD